VRPRLQITNLYFRRITFCDDHGDGKIGEKNFFRFFVSLTLVVGKFVLIGVSFSRGGCINSLGDATWGHRRNRKVWKSFDFVCSCDESQTTITNKYSSTAKSTFFLLVYQVVRNSMVFNFSLYVRGHFDSESSSIHPIKVTRRRSISLVLAIARKLKLFQSVDVLV
jgi:hypothetical protein